MLKLTLSQIQAAANAAHVASDLEQSKDVVVDEIKTVYVGGGRKSKRDPLGEGVAFGISIPAAQIREKLDAELKAQTEFLHALGIELIP